MTDDTRLRYARLLREHDETASDSERLAESLVQLDEWHVEPGPGDVPAALVRLRAQWTVNSSASRAIRVARDRPVVGLASYMALLAAQTRVIQPEFWLISLAIAALGVLVLTNGLGISLTFVLWLIAPLLALIGVHTAFRGPAAAAIEIELACPPSPIRLAVARLTIVLGYQIVLLLLVSVGLSSIGRAGPLAGLVGHWLGPLLLVAGTELLAGLRLRWRYSAGIAYLAWIGCVAIMATVSGSNLAVSLVGVELGLMALGLTAMAMAVRWVRADRLAPH